MLNNLAAMMGGEQQFDCPRNGLAVRQPDPAFLMNVTGRKGHWQLAPAFHYEPRAVCRHRLSERI